MRIQTVKKSPSEQVRRGVMLPLIAFMLVAIMGVIAFVSDLGNVIVVKTTLGASADAAALAGAGAMAESWLLADVKPVAVQYGLANVPANYGTVLDESSVTFGIWDPTTKTFEPNTTAPNAVRVVVERKFARGNEVPYFFAKVFGYDATELSAEAIAVGANSTSATPYNLVRSVYVTSTKDLSNVVLELSNGEHYKYDGLSGYTGNFDVPGSYPSDTQIVGVWIKSGCNHSGDGPGYGEQITNDPVDGFTKHGENKAKGCTPHVTATFKTVEGVVFTESGAASPVRLVK